MTADSEMDVDVGIVEDIFGMEFKILSMWYREKS